LLFFLDLFTFITVPGSGDIDLSNTKPAITLEVVIPFFFSDEQDEKREKRSNDT